MNNPLDASLQALSNCGCCTGTNVQTPAAIDNRPGLAAIDFRVGVHSQFKATLLASLASQQYPALQQLRSRGDSDFSIALLDTFACMADVLTFYSERIANEAYLRTATERRSVLELARAIGYELAPGAAAAVLLAFTAEAGRGAPAVAVIPKGTQVQSIPGPGQKPQTFETALDFTARAAWNALQPRLRAAPPKPETLLAASQLYLAGTTTNLKRGDVLVLSSGTEAMAKRIIDVFVHRELGHTRVQFNDAPETTLAPLAQPSASRAAEATASVPLGPQPTQGIVDGLFLKAGISTAQMQEFRHFYGWDVVKVQKHLNSLPRVSLFAANAGVFAVRARVAFFGHNAPKYATLPFTDRERRLPFPKDWDQLTDPTGASLGPSRIWQDSQGNDLNPPQDNAPDPQFDVLLERPLPEVVAGSWLVLETESSALVPLRVGRNSVLSRADFAMSSQCARLNLKSAIGNSDPVKDSAYTTRGTTAHLQSEPLEVLGPPIAAALAQGLTTLELDRIDTTLAVEQTLMLQGEDANLPGTTQCELVRIADIRHSDVTTLTLQSGLLFSYTRPTVTLNANVVPATHGETTGEVLGSGDAAEPFQRFVLKQQPLTFTFPPGAARLESTLEIWVDELRWREVPTFFSTGPQDRVYVVRLADDGSTSVHFGDGRQGARLPSGRENVRAVYRTGSGREGLVEPEQIALLLTQPLGIKGVTNPLASQGAADPQPLAAARVNAPRTVLTLDRVVSLQDYEDFARDFPGVEKAHAVWAWNGQTRGVLLTLLGPGGQVIDEQGQPAEPLRQSLVQQGLPRVPVRIVSQPPSLFAIGGVVRVQPDRLAARVQADVTAALRAAFSFEARRFGQGVALSEVIAVIQNVPGVALVNVSRFYKTALSAGVVTQTESTASDQSSGYLGASVPVDGASALLAEPAELLMFDEPSLSQLEVRAL